MDASGIVSAVEQVAGAVLPLVAQIPGAGDLIKPVESALAVVEQVTGGDLLQDLQNLATSIAKSFIIEFLTAYNVRN